MKVPRDVSGRRLADTLCRRWGYKEVHQTVSHIVLETDDPGRHRIAIPAHDAVRLGKLVSILRSIASHKGVLRDEIVASL